VGQRERRLATSLPSTDNTPVPPLPKPGPSDLKSNTMVCLPAPNSGPSHIVRLRGVEVPVKDQFLWYPFWGSERTFPHYAAEWAWAMDTPFKWTKQVASHFGGTAQGMAISWPGHITDLGGIRRQFHHVIDIVPTILEALKKW
jgi:arylsulfatase A-like enzyme